MDNALSPTQARTALVAMRTGLGISALLAPRLTGRVFGIDPEANPASVYLARLFGARELFMSAPFLVEDVPEEVRTYALRAGVLVDGADVVAATAACARRGLSIRSGTMAGVLAAVAVGLGVVAQRDD